MKNSLLALALAAIALPLTFAATSKPAPTTPGKTGSSIHSRKSAVTTKSHKTHKSLKTTSHKQTPKKGVVHTASARASHSVKPK